MQKRCNDALLIAADLRRKIQDIDTAELVVRSVPD
jgi:hypothetical protein